MDRQEMREYVTECLAKITGQQPVMTKARMAISNFKTRKGMVVGSVVTLRGRRMEEFLDRLISYALPRIRDFRGLSRKLDGHGNYSIGIRDHSIFPEVPPPDAKQIFGMQVQITTTTDNDQQAFALLKEIGIPFRPEEKREERERRAEERGAREAAQATAREEVAPEGGSASPGEEESGSTQKDDSSVEEEAKKPDTQ